MVITNMQLHLLICMVDYTGMVTINKKKKKNSHTYRVVINQNCNLELSIKEQQIQ